MITKSLQIILFASLVATMILPFGGMNYAVAEEQTEKTDKELIDEWNQSFSNKSVSSDVEPSDEIKIDVMRGLYEAKNNPQELSDADKKYYEEQNKVLEIANALYEKIQRETDPETKQVLEQELENLKPRMAEVGIFTDEDVDNEELQAIHDEYQGTVLDAFQSPDNFLGMVIQFAHAVLGQYQTQLFLHYDCGFLNCLSAKTLAYLDSGDSMNASIVIPSNINLINNVEFRYKVGNTQSSQWQSGYHQAIHYDASWNYLDGGVKSSNEYYWKNAYQTHIVHISNNANAGDQTYQYLYFY